MLIKRLVFVGVLLVGLGLMVPGGEAAVSVSAGALGDALILPLVETTNVDTLIAIENNVGLTVLALVRFRDAETGADVLNFQLCLVPESTWTATVFRDGSLTRVTSASTLLVNGSATPLNGTLFGNPTRAFMEVIGLREASTVPFGSTAVCTDPTTGGDVFNAALSARAYYVNGAQSPPLAYGTDAVALRDFALAKISDGTVFQNDAVAQALIAQGGVGSFDFSTRYFVPASFGAVTQLVLAVPTGPNSGACPNCRLPSVYKIVPFTDAGASLPTFTTPSTSALVRVINLTSSDIANDSGQVHIIENAGFGSIPFVGFGITTTSPSASAFFNVLFHLNNH
jgi:hypothetical protein